NQYPVRPVILDTNRGQTLNLTTKFIKTTSLEPNKTDVASVLFNMGVPLIGAQFDLMITNGSSPAGGNPFKYLIVINTFRADYGMLKTFTYAVSGSG
ncbi:hypothetical protein FBU30_002594, partial [Linnemannia zychae]